MHTMLMSLFLAAICLESGHGSSSTWEERADFEKYYKIAGVSGAFLIYDTKQDKYLAYNSKRLHTPLIPASTFGYGNRNISGGIDKFWLTGGLRITPKEQVDFLVRLCRYDLPFTQSSIDIVKDIMIFEKKNEYVWRAKTGWANQIGWFVGYAERGGNVYFFANSIDILQDDDGEARIQISRNILHDLGIVSF